MVPIDPKSGEQIDICAIELASLGPGSNETIQPLESEWQKCSGLSRCTKWGSAFALPRNVEEAAIKRKRLFLEGKQSTFQRGSICSGYTAKKECLNHAFSHSKLKAKLHVGKIGEESWWTKEDELSPLEKIHRCATPPCARGQRRTCPTPPASSASASPAAAIANN